MNQLPATLKPGDTVIGQWGNQAPFTFHNVTDSAIEAVYDHIRRGWNVISVNRDGRTWVASDFPVEVDSPEENELFILRDIIQRLRDEPRVLINVFDGYGIPDKRLKEILSAAPERN